jgi:hypothetical protein
MVYGLGFIVYGLWLLRFMSCVRSSHTMARKRNVVGRRWYIVVRQVPYGFRRVVFKFTRNLI